MKRADKKSSRILNGQEIKKHLERFCRELLKRQDAGQLAFIGIRTRGIHLAVLIDRGGREFPIAADYVGKKIDLPAAGEVNVRLKEVDKVDEVVITR